MNYEKQRKLEKRNCVVETIRKEYDYDENGFVKREVVKDKYERTYRRDSNGRVIEFESKNLKNGSVIKRDTTYSYYPFLDSCEVSRVDTLKENVKSTKIYEYLHRGDDISKVLVNVYSLTEESKDLIQSIYKEYDSKKRCIHQHVSFGYPKNIEDYEYDSNDNLVKVTAPNNRIECMFYDENNHLIKTLIETEKYTKTIRYRNDKYGNPVIIKIITKRKNLRS